MKAVHHEWWRTLWVNEIYTRFCEFTCSSFVERQDSLELLGSPAVHVEVDRKDSDSLRKESQKLFSAAEPQCRLYDPDTSPPSCKFQNRSPTLLYSRVRRAPTGTRYMNFRPGDLFSVTKPGRFLLLRWRLMRMGKKYSPPQLAAMMRRGGEFKVSC